MKNANAAAATAKQAITVGEAHPSWLVAEFPRARAKIVRGMNSTMAANPFQSNGWRTSPRHSFWMKTESRTASSPTGTFTSKILCQLYASTR